MGIMAAITTHKDDIWNMMDVVAVAVAVLMIFDVKLCAIVSKAKIVVRLMGC